MSIVIGVGQNRMEIQNGKIEVVNVRQYRILQEGNKTPITGYDDSPKILKLIVSDGVVDIVVQTSGSKAYDESAILSKFVPEGYKLIDQKEAAKMIKGVKGKYYYYYNKGDGTYLALVTRGFGRPGRISLGSIEDRSSTLYQVLEKLPKDGTFHKAQLNSILPAKIVENRQPIKAALDILEREGFAEKTGKKIGVSEEYRRTSKPLPVVGLDRFTNKNK